MNIIKPKWFLLATLSSLTMLSSNDIAIESIGINTGYSKIFYSSENLDIAKPTTHLYNLELYTIVENIFDTNTIKATLNYIYNKSDDLSDNNLLIGLNRYDKFDNFIFYSGLLVGYSQLEYQDDYFVDGLSIGIQMGTEFLFTDSLKFNINTKYLVPNYTINLAPKYSAKVTHTGTLSISIGLKYIFSTDTVGKKDIEIYHIQTDNESLNIELKNIADYETVEIDIDKELYGFVDNDNDGINDMLDNCSNSVENEIVDELGCAKDSDDDYILDRLDRCKNSAENEIVDEFGCAKDSDNDKVIDRLDKCMNSVENEIVDNVGCAKDSDDDAIIDRLDRCPNSIKDAIVDDFGCSENHEKERIEKMINSLGLLN